MKQVLLLTDFSESSGKAVEFALQLYEGIPCSFTVLNCYVELPLATDQVDEVVDHNAQTRVNDYVNSLRQKSASDHFSFKGTAVGGNLAVAVTSLYEKDLFDIVVVGASGAGNSVRLGSVATEMIRAARYPVLVVPSSVYVRPLKNIVVATDYQNFRSPEVFEPVRELLSVGAKRLEFLHVVDTDSSRAEVDLRGKALLNEYLKDYSPRHESIRDDSPADGIETYLSGHDTDLLVTISHHHSFWDVLLNRSTSRKLAYEARVPLMVLFETVSDSSEDLPSPDWNAIL